MSKLIIQKQGDGYCLIYNNSKQQTFYLEEITSHNLYEKRRNKIPSFILKEEDKLFWGEVDPKLHFISLEVEMQKDDTVLKNHKCAILNKECAHFYKCPKVNDRNINSGAMLRWSKRIEKYWFITIGYETMYTAQDAFVVLKCAHFYSDSDKEEDKKGKNS